MESNPYSPPDLEHDPVASQPSEVLPWATLGQRFVASILDTLIVLGPVLALNFWAPIPFLNDLWASEGPLSDAISISIGYLCFLALNGYLIHTRDQTIGKLALGIKVTKLDGKSPSTLTQFGLRYGYYYLIDALPQAGTFISIVGVLLIFGRQRRCLHDQLAGTRVVKCR